jgi:Bacterial regulatory proteins, luxR family
VRRPGECRPSACPNRSRGRARSLGLESLEVAEHVGDPWLIASALHLLGIAAYIAADFPAAQGYYERSLAIRRQIGDQEGTGILLSLLGIVAVREREFLRAYDLYRQSVSVTRALLSDWNIAVMLAEFAGLAAAQNQFLQAVRLAGASARLAEYWQTPVIPLIQAVLDEGLARARQTLDPEQYPAVWAEARTMSPEQSLAVALQNASTETDHAPSDGLSATEAQVLRLLASGRTTREIANDLVIAVSTAERHITHVYE